MLLLDESVVHGASLLLLFAEEQRFYGYYIQVFSVKFITE